MSVFAPAPLVQACQSLVVFFLRSIDDGPSGLVDVFVALWRRWPSLWSCQRVVIYMGQVCERVVLFMDLGPLGAAVLLLSLVEMLRSLAGPMCGCRQFDVIDCFLCPSSCNLNLSPKDSHTLLAHRGGVQRGDGGIWDGRTQSPGKLPGEVGRPPVRVAKSPLVRILLSMYCRD